MNDEDLGRLVRETWIKWAERQPDVDEHPNWLIPWEQLSERDREVDVLIGRAVKLRVLQMEVPDEGDEELDPDEFDPEARGLVRALNEVAILLRRMEIKTRLISGIDTAVYEGYDERMDSPNLSRVKDVKAATLVFSDPDCTDRAAMFVPLSIYRDGDIEASLSVAGEVVRKALGEMVEILLLRDGRLVILRPRMNERRKFVTELFIPALTNTLESIAS